MKKNYLLPHLFKKIGLCMSIPFLAGCIYCLFGGADKLSCKVFAVAPGNFSREWFTMYDGGGIFDEICMIGFIISLLFISFSKEKIEDEMIKNIRMQSLIWSLIVSSLILIFGIMFFYGFAFMYFTFMYLFFIYILFIVKFHFELYKMRKNTDE